VHQIAAARTNNRRLASNTGRRASRPSAHFVYFGDLVCSVLSIVGRAMGPSTAMARGARLDGRWRCELLEAFYRDAADGGLECFTRCLHEQCSRDSLQHPLAGLELPLSGAGPIRQHMTVVQRGRARDAPATRPRLKLFSAAGRWSSRDAVRRRPFDAVPRSASGP
jgi:hypothetical protein